jgi:pSer/pThr/pTyr-binding forkhead associated (FHA) protein
MYEVSNQAATAVGRAPGNDVVVEDPAVSSQHCRIRPADGGGFELIDLKSTNGTFLNERRVTREQLAAGDNIKVGQTVLQFRMDHLKG